jgi:deoxynucleotide monophosphate kinase, putative
MIIALTGKAGAGKDYAAAKLAMMLPHYGINCHTNSFAAPIYRMLEALGVDINYYAKRENKEAVIPGLGVSLRHLLQTLGTEWGRKLVKESIWVDCMVEHYSNIPKDDCLIITDCRFPDEAAWVQSMQGKIIRITAIVQRHSTATKHESEKMAFEADFTITNNYTPNFDKRLACALERIIDDYS